MLYAHIHIRDFDHARFVLLKVDPSPHNRIALTNGRSFSLCRRIVKTGLVRCWSKDDDFDGVYFQVRRRLKLSVDSWSLPRCCLAAASRSILHFYSTSVLSWILSRHGSFALYPCMAMLLYIIWQKERDADIMRRQRGRPDCIVSRRNLQTGSAFSKGYPDIVSSMRD